jgi:hypothetical protein
MSCSRAGPGNAPGCENTSAPSRKAISVGIDMMPAARANATSASVSILPNTMSPCCSAAASKTGANMRHGPHHDAHQSTNTISLSLIVDSKVSSDRLMVATISS